MQDVNPPTRLKFMDTSVERLAKAYASGLIDTYTHVNHIGPMQNAFRIGLIAGEYLARDGADAALKAIEDSFQRVIEKAAEN